VRQAVELSGELGIKHLTVYAFSTENWNRPQEEVSGLMKLFLEFISKEIAELNRKGVVVRIMGSKQGVDPDFLKRINDIARPTWGNTGLCFNVAFNYGGRQEIVEAVQNIMTQGLKPEEVTAELISSCLYTQGTPDPDLIIRTSGEMRLSNFLIWQSAYSEIYITETLWPDFDKQEYIKALLDYQARNRRFGGI
jgi:undecaprenyl diphosphate synthase